LGLDTKAKRPLAKEADQMSSDAIATIRQLLSEGYGGLVMAHDAAGYAAQYSEDVLWSPPNAPNQTSVEGTQTAIQGLFDKFSFQVDPQPEEIEVLGDFAYAIGSVDGVLTPRAGGDPVSIKFCIFWLLRKEAGEWKISRQIWNNKPVG
jgi:ketosteroid isomerase-like protein